MRLSSLFEDLDDKDTFVGPLGPGSRVKVVRDTTNHGIPLGSVITLVRRHPHHEDAWFVKKPRNVFVRTIEMEYPVMDSDNEVFQ